MSEDFATFFSRVTEGLDPYPYQVRLGTRPWPDILDVPTGLGKTAAIALAWLWKRLHRDPETPTRLLYCLPMRVLVEQTAETVGRWVARAGPHFEAAGLQAPTTHVVMGGEVDAGWIDEPGCPACIVGTQDMLLSRALMRGYGMSRYQWPIHFGLLHNDTLWVLDEIQLMGPGLPTSAQLEAFRRDLPGPRPCRSLWMSATLDRAWLDTVDFRPHLPGLGSSGLDPGDRDRASGRLEAAKDLRVAPVRLDRAGARRNAQAYVDALAGAVIEAHRHGTQSLVILNQVSRAQALYRRLAKEDLGDGSLLLLHARFRPGERRGIEAALRDAPTGGRIVVATQAIEAGVDISSATLFTELAPWSSLVQRFGRCNRYGEVEGGANVYWIDIEGDAEVMLPYREEALRAARDTIVPLSSAAIADLPPVRGAPPVHPVLRRRDFRDLFDTEPDLSGFDIDVSPYVRDPGPPQVQVFWRAVGDACADQGRPERDELCPVSMGQMRRYLEVRTDRHFWTWDGLDERWVRASPREQPRPGSMLMLPSADGGYTSEVGFDPVERAPVPPVTRVAPGRAEDAMGTDPATAVGRFVLLDEHTRHVRKCVAELAASLELGEHDRALLDTAALWHDLGKAHPAFQRALLDFRDRESGDASEPDAVWAKSSEVGRLRYRIEADGVCLRRDYFRHELASVLSWLEHIDGDDLVAFLVAAHHGKLRMSIRALPGEAPPPDERRFARGVWEGDRMPPLQVDGLSLPATDLRLDVMEIGLGAQGPSWTERTHRLVEREGPFRLSWLETILRLADQRASAQEQRASARGAGAS